MVWKIVGVGCIVDYLKACMSLDFMPKLTRYTVKYIGSFMGKAARCHREIVTKRLHKRKKRRLEECKEKSKVRSSQCSCSKCKGFRYVQKKRVIEPDFLANLAYSQRISRDNETSMDGNYNEPVGEITLSPGETWWNNIMNQRSNMPPLYSDPLMKSTRSEYSSATSGFRSATPDIFGDAIELSRSVTPLSADTDKSRPEDTNHLSQPREGSKSDSKILPCREDNRQSKIGPRMTTRSTSMALGISKKEGRGSTMRNNKTEKKRNTSNRTTSHGSDCFSTCVKCSRILSRQI